MSSSFSNEKKTVNKPKYYNELQKISIYKWRDNNKDKVKQWRDENQDLIKATSKKWFEANKKKEYERLRIANLRRYYYKKECKRLCSILLF